MAFEHKYGQKIFSYEDSTGFDYSFFNFRPPNNFICKKCGKKLFPYEELYIAPNYFCIMCHTYIQTENLFKTIALCGLVVGTSLKEAKCLPDSFRSFIYINFYGIKLVSPVSGRYLIMEKKDFGPYYHILELNYANSYLPGTTRKFLNPERYYGELNNIYMTKIMPKVARKLHGGPPKRNLIKKHLLRHTRWHNPNIFYFFFFFRSENYPKNILKQIVGKFISLERWDAVGVSMIL